MRLFEEQTTKTSPQKDKNNETHLIIDSIDKHLLSDFFTSVGSIFITYLTSNCLKNLKDSQIYSNWNIICVNRSLLLIFQSQIEMELRRKSFKNAINDQLLNIANIANTAIISNDIDVQSCVWNINYYYRHLFSDVKYNHSQTMKMMIVYICLNGIHPFIGIDCDKQPNCQWSDSPQCRIRCSFNKFLSQATHFPHGNSFQNAWKMKQHFIDIDIHFDEVLKFLFPRLQLQTMIEMEDMENQTYDRYNNDDIDSDSSESEDIPLPTIKDLNLQCWKTDFTLFTFRNECDFTYNVQFDILKCDGRNLDIIDSYEITCNGQQIKYGTFFTANSEERKKHNFGLYNFWYEMKYELMGKRFVNINEWYIMCIHCINTIVFGSEQNFYYYLMCAEIDGSYERTRKYKFTKYEFENYQMFSKLLVWKTRFYCDQQYYAHE